jgi:hypothetical protein
MWVCSPTHGRRTLREQSRQSPMQADEPWQRSRRAVSGSDCAVSRQARQSWGQAGILPRAFTSQTAVSELDSLCDLNETV